MNSHRLVDLVGYDKRVLPLSWFWFIDSPVVFPHISGLHSFFSFIMCNTITINDLGEFEVRMPTPKHLAKIYNNKSVSCILVCNNTTPMCSHATTKHTQYSCLFNENNILSVSGPITNRNYHCTLLHCLKKGLKSY